ncbi:MAG: hypothetical protein AB7V46_14815 [Thermomicrobiales bacterium]
MAAKIRHLVVVVVAMLCISGVVVPLAAQEATPQPAPNVLSADVEFADLTLGEWSARWWQWVISFPMAVNPSFDGTGERCHFGQSGPLFFLASSPNSVERSCTVPEGMAIFIPLAHSQCSTADVPPYFGRDAAELAQCATRDGNASGVGGISLRVDGELIPDLASYRATTPPFTQVVGADNMYGLPAGVSLAVGDGFQVILMPLPPGEHEVVFAWPGPQGNVVVTYHLTVAEPAIR